ncbi:MULTISPECIES: hypothetical protein [Bacillus cereus group]|uniref:Uncharacterized protein n=1 Tax=Bacillus thuringiensis TaxID=1428 RepID=A0A1C4E461_BACTU|nr:MULTISPECIES: hypothetical protein [Bacillus cereus group]MED3025676.1 hypothetical protein [Bacillus wiedmannii]SCC38311.1 Protein of unknown function [Bacillus thuringiensis]
MEQIMQSILAVDCGKEEMIDDIGELSSLHALAFVFTNVDASL